MNLCPTCGKIGGHPAACPRTAESRAYRRRVAAQRIAQRYFPEDAHAASRAALAILDAWGEKVPA